MKRLIRMAGALLLLVFLSLPATALAAESITCTPSAGPAGTVFVVSGTGFTNWKTGDLDVYIKNSSGKEMASKKGATVANGELRLTYDSSGDAPGTYTVQIYNGQKLVIQGTFDVTAAAGMPATGGGGGAAVGLGLSQTLLAGLGLVAVAGLAAGVVLRRRHAS